MGISKELNGENRTGAPVGQVFRNVLLVIRTMDCGLPFRKRVREKTAGRPLGTFQGTKLALMSETRNSMPQLFVKAENPLS